MFLAAFVLLLYRAAMNQNQPVKATRHKRAAFFKINFNQTPG
jgi:hypothetical protein